MKPEPGLPAAPLARAWRAFVRFFTPASGASVSHRPSADTTSFGGWPEHDRTTSQGDLRSNRWDPTGESTDFAEPDLDPHRRRDRS